MSFNSDRKTNNYKTRKWTLIKFSVRIASKPLKSETQRIKFGLRFMKQTKQLYLQNEIKSDHSI